MGFLAAYADGKIKTQQQNHMALLLVTSLTTISFHQLTPLGWFLFQTRVSAKLLGAALGSLDRAKLKPSLLSLQH